MNQKSLEMKFDFPTSWRHGRGLAGESGSILRDLGCNRTLLLTDKLLVDLGVVKPVISSLEQSDLSYILRDDVTEEPTVGFFETFMTDLDIEDFDSILAVGGGSVIDVAKALAVIAQFVDKSRPDCLRSGHWVRRSRRDKAHSRKSHSRSRDAPSLTAQEFRPMPIHRNRAGKSLPASQQD